LTQLLLGLPVVRGILVASMNTRWLLALATLAAAISTACAAPKAQSTKHVLFFTKSAGFEHSAIKWKDGTSFAETVLKELGPQHNIEFTFSKDGTIFTPENLKKFDAFMFYTTGDLTTVGTDGHPAMSKEAKAAFLDAIKHGKGFIGVHSSTDTFHSPGGENIKTKARYSNDGDNADPYIKMIGGEFIKHGKQQPGHLICVDKKFPGLSNFPDDFAPTEEWYSLKDFAPNMHVLLVQDTSKMHDKIYERPNYPSTWAHMYGKGRVFYTNMGHREDVWTNPVFQQVLMGGFEWTLRRADADVKPNIKKVTPKADVLPPMD
jgi:type 1 glutamine amidotransferase